MIVESDDLAVLVEPRLDGMDIGRAVSPAAHVVLARPLYLHRFAGAERARRRDRLDDEVGIGDRAAAETAAGLHHMQLHLVRRGAADLGCGRLIDVGHLMPAPDVDGAVLVDAGDGIERFDRGMNEIGKLVMSFDHLVRRSPAPPSTSPSLRAMAAAGPSAALLYSAMISAVPRFSALASFHFTVDQIAAFQSGPHIGADHGDAARRLDNVDDAVKRLGLGRVEAFDLRAEFRRMDHDGGHKTIHLQVDGVGLGAVGLAVRVVALEIVRADLGPLVARLQLHIVRDGHFSGGLRQFAEGCALARCHARRYRRQP